MNPLEVNNWMYFFVHSISTNDTGSQWGIISRDGQGVLRTDEEHSHEERMPLQVFGLQGKKSLLRNVLLKF